jgi:hypothetical protein
MKKFYSLAGALSLIATGALAQSPTLIAPKANKVIAQPYGTISKTTSNNHAKVAAPMAGDTVGYSMSVLNDFRPEFAAAGQIYRYGYLGGGNIFGKNYDSLNICGQGWKNLNGTPLIISKAIFWVFEKQNVGSAASKIRVGLWDMAANKAYNTNGSTGVAQNSMGPNTQKSYVDLTWAQIDTGIVNQERVFTVATFSTPVAINGDFAISVSSQSLAAGDTIGILADKNGDALELDYCFMRFAAPGASTASAWYVTDYLFSPAASNGTGSLDISLAMFGILDVGTAVKEFVNGVKLNALYPNPTKDVATIAYSLEKASTNVSLMVLDSKGAKVYEQAYGNQSAGEYKVNIDATNFAAGSYYYQLRSNGSQITKEFVVVK